jgi:hypothetical protein
MECRRVACNELKYRFPFRKKNLLLRDFVCGRQAVAIALSESPEGATPLQQTSEEQRVIAISN